MIENKHTVIDWLIDWQNLEAVGVKKCSRDRMLVGLALVVAAFVVVGTILVSSDCLLWHKLIFKKMQIYGWNKLVITSRWWTLLCYQACRGQDQLRNFKFCPSPRTSVRETKSSLSRGPGFRDKFLKPRCDFLLFDHIRRVNECTLNLFLGDKSITYFRSVTFGTCLKN